MAIAENTKIITNSEILGTLKGREQFDNRDFRDRSATKVLLKLSALLRDQLITNSFASKGTMVSLPRVNETRKLCIKRVDDGSNYHRVKIHRYSHLNNLCPLQEDLFWRNRQES